MKPIVVYDDSDDQELYLHSEIMIGLERSKNVAISAGTIANSPEKPNEDAFAVGIEGGQLFAGLFDGTTSLKAIQSLGDQTGARFASHFLKDNFLQYEGVPAP